MIIIAQEKAFENRIKKFIESKGGWYVKFFANSFTKSGIPDLLCCVNGYFVAIEVKAKNGKPSELQIYNKEKIRSAGGICIILYPNQFKDFKDVIEDLLSGDGGSFRSYRRQFDFDKEER